MREFSEVPNKFQIYLWTNMYEKLALVKMINVLQLVFQLSWTRRKRIRKLNRNANISNVSIYSFNTPNFKIHYIYLSIAADEKISANRENYTKSSAFLLSSLINMRVTKLRRQCTKTLHFILRL